MVAIRRILVAVKDPTAKSLPAVAKAAQIAAAFGSKIELFHDMTSTVYTGFPGGIVPDAQAFQREHRAARLDQLEKIAVRLLDQGLQVSVAAEWDYPAHEAIVRRAMATKADLIVAQHHPVTRHLTWLLRFTDWELLRLSPLPVLLVKSPRPYRRPVVLAAIDPLHAFGKPAKLDRRILDAGAMITDGLRGKLHAVHAYMTLPAGAIPTVAADARIAMQVQRDAEREAGVAFDRALRSTKVPRGRRHLVGGDPANVITEVSRRIHGDIVVLGAISRSGIKRAFIGNTAERLIDELRGDLLVVKPANFAIRIPRAQRGVRVPRASGRASTETRAPA
jgi:universal stress protein E